MEKIDVWKEMSSLISSLKTQLNLIDRLIARSCNQENRLIALEKKAGSWPKQIPFEKAAARICKERYIEGYIHMLITKTDPSMEQKGRVLLAVTNDQLWTIYIGVYRLALAEHLEEAAHRFAKEINKVGQKEFNWVK